MGARATRTWPLAFVPVCVCCVKKRVRGHAPQFDAIFHITVYGGELKEAYRRLSARTLVRLCLNVRAN